MRIPLTLTLFEKTAPEDHELQISWDVLASADVRRVDSTWQHPGEQTIEDLQIDAVTAVWLTYGEAGSVIVPAEADSLFAGREAGRTLSWLRRQLPERDDWSELLIQEAVRRASDFHSAARDRWSEHSPMTQHSLHSLSERAAT
jgi:hypothetical protein